MKIRTLTGLISCVLIGASATAHAYTVVEGHSMFNNVGATPVQDGVANGVQRNTYFKDRHYQVPEGREVGSYYATWGVYEGRGYKPHQLPVERLTHVYVAFGGVCGENPGANNSGAGLKDVCTDLSAGSDMSPYYFPGRGAIPDGEVSFIDDKWGMLDLQIQGPDGSYSQIQGMMDWKKRNPDLKVIWSIGGWSYSRPIFEVTATAENRSKFVVSVIAWLNEGSMGFVDGIDIDWEFPGGLGLDSDVGDAAVDGYNYSLLLKELREEMDTLGQNNGKYYELSVAIGVGPAQLANWKLSSTIKESLQYVDRFGLMTYDFAGSWNSEVGFNAAVSAPDGSAQVNIETVLTTLRDEHNVTPEDMSKISLGLGFYGRSHGSVASALPQDLPGSASTGAGAGGTIEDGSFSYFDLYDNYIGTDGTGINGWSVYHYPEFGGNLLYNLAESQVISYTSPTGIAAIVNLVTAYNLKGVFSWEADDDNGMLLEAVHQTFGHQQTTINPGKQLVYAPNCQETINSVPNFTIKPGMVFEANGKVNRSVGWAEKCPYIGEQWEQNNWEELDSSQMVVMGGTSPVTNVPPISSNPGIPVPPINSNPVPVPPISSNPVPVPTTVVTSWVQDKVYAQTGNVVTYNGQTWRNSWWTNGQPGLDAAWKIVSVAPVPLVVAPVVPVTEVPLVVAPVVPLVPANTALANGNNSWIPGKAYTGSGHKVTHNGKTWESKWWTNGEPGVDGAWKNISPVARDSSGAEIWVQGKVYAEGGHIVSHNGQQWKNSWYTTGEPGVDGAWKLN